MRYFLDPRLRCWRPLPAPRFAGCSHKVNVHTSQGSVSVDRSNGSTTIKTGSGEVSVGKGAVDPASLGLPVYPARRSPTTARIVGQRYVQGRRARRSSC